jgi:hypothetical protein
MSTESNIYVPKDCMNQIIDQLKLLNTKKFIIVVSICGCDESTYYLNDVKCFVVEANSKEEALRYFIKTKVEVVFQLLGGFEFINFEGGLRDELRELIYCCGKYTEEHEIFLEKYEKLLIPIIMKNDHHIKIKEIKVGEIF